jgi:hypothetical protein
MHFDLPVLLSQNLTHQLAVSVTLVFELHW